MHLNVISDPLISKLRVTATLFNIKRQIYATERIINHKG